MELHELMEKKRQLATDIARLLDKFEEETGLDVSSLDMVRQDTYMLNEEGVYHKNRYVVDPKIMLWWPRRYWVIRLVRTADTPTLPIVRAARELSSYASAPFMSGASFSIIAGAKNLKQDDSSRVHSSRLPYHG